MVIVSKIKSLFKKVAKYTPAKEIKLHPKFNKSIEWSFSIDGTDYYKLSNSSDTYGDRWPFMLQFLNEMQMKMTKDTLNDFMDKIIANFEVQDKEDFKIDLGMIYMIAKEIKHRSEWLFEPDALYRLASVVYFPLEEDIRVYDLSYNQNKIETFKKKRLMNHFLKNLSDGVNPFLSFSSDAFQTYLQEIVEKTSQESSIFALPKREMPLELKEIETLPLNKKPN